MADGVEVGKLYASLRLDKSQFERGLRDGRGLFGSLAGMAVKAAAVITGAFVAFGAAAAHNADEQERADERVRSVFGKASQEFIDWTKKRSLALRVQDDVLEDWGAKAVQTFKGVGISQGQSILMTQRLMERAADISAQTGKSFDTVFGALLKGAAGSTKGLKDLGIVIDANEIKQTALAMGLWDGKGALDAGTKAAVIYQLALEKSASATGAAAERSGSMREQLKALPVVMDSILDAAGRAFLPIANIFLPIVVGALQGLAEWIESNMPAIESTVKTVASAIGIAFGFLVKQVLPILISVFNTLVNVVLPAVVKAIRPVIDGFGDVAESTGPFVDAISAIGARVAEFLSQGNNLQDLLIALGVVITLAVVPPFVAWAAATIAATWPLLLIGAAVFALVKILDDLGLLGPIVETVTRLMGDAFAWLSTEVLPVLIAAFDFFMAEVLPAITEALGAIAATVIPIFGEAFNWLVTNILPPVMDIIGTIANVILPALGRAFQAVVTWVVANLPTMQKIWETVAGAIGAVISAAAAVVKTAFEIIANVIRTVAPVIVAVGEVLFPALGAAATVLLGTMSTIFSAIGAVWNTAWDVARTVVGGIGAAWSGLTGVIRTVWNTISGIVRGGANFLIGIVNGVISAVNGIQVHIGRIGIDTPSGFMGVGPFDWNGLNISHLRYLAAGSTNFAGGWAMLGESGRPELARLPTGTRVFNGSDTSNILAGAGQGREVHYHLNVQGLVRARDPFEIATQQRRLADFGQMVMGDMGDG